MIRNFDQMIDKAKETSGGRKRLVRVAVAAGNDSIVPYKQFVTATQRLF